MDTSPLGSSHDFTVLAIATNFHRYRFPSRIPLFTGDAEDDILTCSREIGANCFPIRPTLLHVQHFFKIVFCQLTEKKHKRDIFPRNAYIWQQEATLLIHI